MPSALAAGEGTTAPGVSDDPFTGSPAPVSPSTAGSDGFRFFGSGFGHGVGMSQWGAYGLAQMGWSHKRILKHFYRGTRVGRIADPVGRIRVGLAWDEKVVHVAAKGGPVKLSVGSRAAARSPASPQDEPGRYARRRPGSPCGTTTAPSSVARPGAARRST